MIYPEKEKAAVTAITTTFMDILQTISKYIHYIIQTPKKQVPETVS